MTFAPVWPRAVATVAEVQPRPVVTAPHMELEMAVYMIEAGLVGGPATVDAGGLTMEKAGLAGGLATVEAGGLTMVEVGLAGGLEV